MTQRNKPGIRICSVVAGSEPDGYVIQGNGCNGTYMDVQERKNTKWVSRIAAVILAAVLLLIGSFIYAARYRISDIDAATSPDGKHEIVFQAIGDPDWPFGYSHARIVLKRNGEIVTERKSDVANDGGVLHPDNWSVRWEEDCVKVIISGEEQSDELYTFLFDGTVRYESLAVPELEAHEPVSQEVLLDETTTEFSDIVVENVNGESVFAIPIESFIHKDEAFLVNGRIPHSIWNNREDETVMLGISVRKA